MPRALPVSLLLALLVTTASNLALACAEGETEVCLGGCICVPDPNGVLAPYQEQAGAVAASALEGWLLRSRDSAAQRGRADPRKYASACCPGIRRSCSMRCATRSATATR